MLALVAAMAFAPVAEPGNIFGFDGFRLQTIRRMANESEWPFVAAGGMLACIRMGMEPTVYFIPETAEGQDGHDRAFLISEDVIMMAMVNLGMTDVLLPYQSLEQLIVRISPYIETGRKLCRQPPGTVLPGTEL